MPRTWLQGLGFLLGFLLALSLSPFAGKADEGGAEAQLEAWLLSEVNAVRDRHHLIPLQRDPALDRVARGHSLDMARRGFMSHVNPEGANPVDRIQRAGIDGFTLAAENLGRTDVLDAPSREIVRAWLASQDHRENLLAPPFNRTGIGVARSSDGALVFTQLYVTVPK